MFPDYATEMIGHAGKNLIRAGNLADFSAVSRGSAQMPCPGLKGFSIHPLRGRRFTKIDKIDAGRNIFLFLAGDNSQRAPLAWFRIIGGRRPCFSCSTN